MLLNDWLNNNCKWHTNCRNLCKTKPYRFGRLIWFISRDVQNSHLTESNCVECVNYIFIDIYNMLDIQYRIHASTWLASWLTYSFTIGWYSYRILWNLFLHTHTLNVIDMVNLQFNFSPVFILEMECVLSICIHYYKNFLNTGNVRQWILWKGIDYTAIAVTAAYYLTTSKLNVHELLAKWIAF